jgi:hypothetical protein
MRKRLALFAVLLCALPASGDNVPLSDDQVDTLTQIDAMPTRAQIDLEFGATGGLAALIALAKDPGRGLDLQIRAIRTLPQFCATGTCAGEPHDSLSSIINGYLAALPGPLPPSDMLRLRAAIEALGTTRSGLAGDVHQLAVSQLLRHPNRDVQVTTVHALRDLCSRGLCTRQTCTEDAAAVRALRSTTGETQLDAAINSALQDLAQCDQP